MGEDDRLAEPTRPPRRLEPSAGPGISEGSRSARVLRVLIPLVFAGALAVVVAVFFAGLDPGDGQVGLGPETGVRAAVADRPRRVCYEGAQPCAWITVVDGELLALSTNGPLSEEFGRQGVGWCPTSGGYGANATGSRFDAAGVVVRGPAPRGLDRYALLRDPQGRVFLDYFSLTTGQRAGAADPLPADGPDCAEIPFDREPELSASG